MKRLFITIVLLVSSIVLLAQNTSYNVNTIPIDGSACVAIGHQALLSNTDWGWYNAAVGYKALISNTTGSHNTAIGHNALYLNTTGDFNIAIGSSALIYNVTGNKNTAIGC